MLRDFSLQKSDIRIRLKILTTKSNENKQNFIHIQHYKLLKFLLIYRKNVCVNMATMEMERTVFLLICVPKIMEAAIGW